MANFGLFSYPTYLTRWPTYLSILHFILALATTSFSNCIGKRLKFPKVEQKVDTLVLTKKRYVFKMTQKLANFWATFVREFVTETSQNIPIWSHCLIASDHL